MSSVVVVVVVVVVVGMVQGDDVGDFSTELKSCSRSQAHRPTQRPLTDWLRGFSFVLFFQLFRSHHANLATVVLARLASTSSAGGGGGGAAELVVVLSWWWC